MKTKAWMKTLATMMALVMMLAVAGLGAIAEDLDPQTPEVVEEMIIEEMENVEEEETFTPDDEASPPVVESTPEKTETTETTESPSSSDVDATETEENTETDAVQPVYVEVVFSANGITQTSTVEQGKAVEKPTMSPVMEGFQFVHWYNEKGDALIAFDFNTTINEKLTLVAYFEEIIVEETEVVLDEDGNEVSAGTDTAASSENGSVVGEIDNELGLKILVVDGEEVIDGEDEEGEEASEDGLEDEDLLDEEEFIIEDEEIPLAGPAPTVYITSDAGEYAAYGDVITLTANVTGLDGRTFTSDWFLTDANGGITAVGTGMVHQYVFTEEHEGTSWTVEITVLAEEAAQEIIEG